jgi:hypothetical protein
LNVGYNMDQVTAQALTLFDKFGGPEGKGLNEPSRGGTRRTRSMGAVKANLVPMEGLAKNGAVEKGAAPPVSAEMVGSE